MPKFENKISEDSLRTGWRQLDEMTDGLRRGALVTMASRPGMGKTSLALSIAQRVSEAQKHRVVLFSLELSAEEVSKRLLAQVSGVDIEMPAKEFEERHWNGLSNAAALLAKAKVFIEDSPSSAEEICGKCEALRSKEGEIDLVVVDYLQLVNPDRLTENKYRRQELTNIAREFKKLAKKLNCTVLALCLLPREIDERPNPRPTLSDLRWCGAIEQDSDVVIFPFQAGVLAESQDELLMELNVAKSRAGDVGTLKVHCKKSNLGLSFGREIEAV